jgi:hypothetical protein
MDIATATRIVSHRSLMHSWDTNIKVFRIFISHDYRIVKSHFLSISDFIFRNPCSTFLLQVAFKFRSVLNSALSHEDTRRNEGTITLISDDRVETSVYV